jgi:hypothetical protein
MTSSFITKFLNRILPFRGSVFWVEGSNLRRKLPFGLSYIAKKFDSPEYANHILSKLNKALK